MWKRAVECGRGLWNVAVECGRGLWKRAVECGRGLWNVDEGCGMWKRAVECGRGLWNVDEGVRPHARCRGEHLHARHRGAEARQRGVHLRIGDHVEIDCMHAQPARLQHGLERAVAAPAHGAMRRDEHLHAHPMRTTSPLTCGGEGAPWWALACAPDADDLEVTCEQDVREHVGLCRRWPCART